MRPSLLIFLAACATTTAQSPASSPAQKGPDWPTLLARELPEMPRQKLTDPSGIFSVEVETSGAATFTKHSEQSQLVSFPIGTQSPVTCIAFTERPDFATQYQRITESVGAQPGLSVEGVSLTDVRVVDGRPLVGFLLVYGQQTQNGQKNVGTMKTWFGTGDGPAFTCSHDEPGYTKTFLRIAEQFAHSFAHKDAKPFESARKEIMRMTIGEQVVGFAETLDIGNVTTEINMVFINRSATEFYAEDSATVSVFDKKNELTKKQMFRSAGGENDMELTLTREKAGYAYTGTLQGKKLEGVIASKQPIFHTQTQLVQMKQLLDGKKPALTWYEWVPSVSATELITQVAKKDGERRIAYEMSGQMTVLSLDDKGTVESIKTPMGKLELNAKRVYAK